MDYREAITFATRGSATEFKFWCLEFMLKGMDLRLGSGVWSLRVWGFGRPPRDLPQTHVSVEGSPNRGDCHRVCFADRWLAHNFSNLSELFVCSGELRGGEA